MFTASTLITSRTLPIINVHDEVEVVREQILSDLIRPLVPDLLPEGRDLPQVGAVLDLTCGQGGLVRDLAYAYPEVEVAGLDAGPALIATNGAQARTQGLLNASFGVVDLGCPPFDFSEASFDLVTASFLRSRLEEAAFPPLLAECQRLLKPGGWLRLVECEAGGCTSLALEELSRLYEQALERAGLHPIPAHRAHDLDGRGAMRALLAEAGVPVHAVRRATLDFSAHQPAYGRMQQVILVFFELVRPFVLHTELLSEEAYDALLRQAACEMSLRGFEGRWHLLILWGHKSAVGSTREAGGAGRDGQAGGAYGEPVTG